jgi:serine/threonine-protein kinase HipA
MRAARHLGLRVADTEVARFADEFAVVVTRYDRTRSGGVRRLHQEDLAQALGLPPDLKYQSDGGPSMASIAKLLRASLRPRMAQAAVWEFMLLCGFNWIALATDGHAKNFSLLHSARGPSLAPGYDIASALPYPDLANKWTARLAMSVGGHYRDRDIEARHWRREAVSAGIDPEEFTARLRQMAGRFPAAVSEAAGGSSLTGDGAAFAARLVDLASARSEVLRLRLR